MSPIPSLPALQDGTRLKLLQVTEERDRLLKEKEEEATVFNSKLQAMERSYEAILQVQCIAMCEEKGIMESNHNILTDFNWAQ